MTPAKRSRGLIIVGGVLALIGLVVGVVGVFVVARAASVLGEETFSTPVSSTLELAEGSYTVYQETSPGLPTFDPARIGPENITVTGPSGQRIPVESPTAVTETLTRGGIEYLGVARFRAPVDGDYRIEIASASTTRVIIGPSVTSIIGGFFFGLGSILLASLLVIIGVILLVVGMVRRNRGPSPVMPPGVPVPMPAGWYPDPEYPGRQRYFNGASWTSHMR